MEGLEPGGGESRCRRGDIAPPAPRLFAGFCATCGRDIWEGDTARTDGEDLFCSAECAGEALTREVYARADGRDERVGEDTLTFDEAMAVVRKYHRLRGHAMGLVLGWLRIADYAKRQGWEDVARRYHAVADELAMVLREIESPATTGHAAGDGHRGERGTVNHPRPLQLTTAEGGGQP